MWFRTASVLLLCTLCSSEAQTEEACGPNQPQVIKIYTTGLLYSPGFQSGQLYPNNVKCHYELHAPYGMKIRMKFNDMDIQATDSCQADSLDVSDSESWLGRLCGNVLPNDYVSRSNEMTLQFTSDEIINRKGFNISYTVTDKLLCSEGQLTCGNRKCVEHSLKCDGHDDCGDGTDEEKCDHAWEATACGLPEVPPAASDRIVGGAAAAPGSWPWMVSMQHRLLRPGSHYCGGSLINAQWVLTAAHCFGGLREPGLWRIHLGTHKKFEKDPHEQIRNVERIVIFDDIPSSKFESDGKIDIVHDVALVKLNAPVKFTDFVLPVCLPADSGQLNSSSRCFATGWGATRGSGHSDVLKQAYHPIQNDNVCINLVHGSFVPSTMICAGTTAVKNGICHGDSGGPLVCQINDRWHIMGVASYITDGNLVYGLCGLKDRPSVFNKIQPKISWIVRMMYKYR